MPEYLHEVKVKSKIFIIVLLLVALSISARADLNDGLIAYYPFNGNAMDFSGNELNGTVNGATLSASELGNPNSAYLFQGSSYISVNDPLGKLCFDPRVQDYTVSLWVKMTTTAFADQTFIDDRGTGQNSVSSYSITYSGHGFFEAGAWDGINGVGVSSTTFPVAGQWYHLAMVVKNGTFYLYVNSVQEGTPQNIPGGFLSAKNSDGVRDIGKAGPSYQNFSYAVIDGVRIYNRALSGLEIQQLYSLPDIGTAPPPPTVVQTNRTPTSAELGSQTNGVLEVFTNGNFVSGVALDPDKMTVVLTHGWNDSSTNWPWEMAELLQFKIGLSSLNIVAWDWSQEANTNLVFAEFRTQAEGRALGINLLAALGTNYSNSIHFIGHSLGTLVNAAAADYLHGDAAGIPPVKGANAFLPQNTHLTLFDEAEVGSGFVGNGLLTALTLLVNDSTTQPFFYHPLPKRDAWADNYISAFGLLHHEAANVILTNLFPSPTRFPDVLVNELTAFHGYPYVWYDDSITTPFGSSMGFRWSFEENHLAPPPPTNTFFIQAFNGSDLDLVATDFSSATNLLNARIRKMLTPFQYALVATVVLVEVNNAIQQANVQDTLTQDPYALTTGQPEAWGINVNLATSSSSSGSLTPQIKVKPLGLNANDDSSDSTNFPAYVWIPLAVPTNAVSMSFDFTFQGDGASDSFAVALNGTNVFSLATDLIQTNVTMNSGQVDVSQYAGTNVELFLGIVGGTSTNANITASGFRFYSVLPPSLQPQSSGSNFILTWPLSVADYTLESSTDLISWTTNTDVPEIVDLQNTITNSISGGARFYRLKK